MQLLGIQNDDRWEHNIPIILDHGTHDIGGHRLSQGKPQDHVMLQAERTQRLTPIGTATDEHKKPGYHSCTDMELSTVGLRHRTILCSHQTGDSDAQIPKLPIRGRGCRAQPPTDTRTRKNTGQGDTYVAWGEDSWEKQGAHHTTLQTCMQGR